MADNTNKALRSMMIYQIFVRNYGAEGSFAAVERDLPRIRALGADIVYLMPIHPIGVKRRKGSLGSPYAIRDYRAVNPEYGTMEDFRRLADAIHGQGMRCMIDVVFNHTSPDSVLAAEHPEWFHRRTDGTPRNRVAAWSDVIDLDYGNPALWDYLIDTLKFWGGMVDGFRCDVAPMVPVAFWERARREVEAVRPGCIWLAESAEGGFIRRLRDMGIPAHSDGELYRAFDICYDYDTYPALSAYLYGSGPLGDYAAEVNRQEHIFPDNYVKLRFLENHDQARAAFLLPDARALRNATAFSLFQKGTAFLYAGQEYGISHLPGLFDRDAVRLEPENGADLSGLIAAMMRIKRAALFQNSAYTVTACGDDALVAVHARGEARAVGVFSMKGRAVHVPVPLPDGLYRNQLTGEAAEVFRGGVNTWGEPLVLCRI